MVDQHDEREIERRVLALGDEVLARVAGPSSGLDDLRALGHELIRNVDRLVEESAAVVAQVEDQTGHALLAQLASARSSSLPVARAKSLIST